jgi:hypothetical protein
MGQEYDWSSLPDQESGYDWSSLPDQPESTGLWNWNSLLGSTESSSPGKFSDFSPGDQTPGESPYYKPDENFWYDAAAVPRTMFSTANELGKRGAAQIGEGNYTGAANTIFEPLTDLFKPKIDMGAAARAQLPAMLGGIPQTPEQQAQAKHQVGLEALGIAGLPEDFPQAWRQGNLPKVAAQAMGAAAMLGGGHAAGEMFRPVEAAPPVPVEATPPSDFIQRPPSYTDKTLGGNPVVSPEFMDSVLPFTDPQQAPLDFGAYRGPRGRFTKEGPGIAPKFGPEVGSGELQGAFDFGEPPSTDVQPNLFGPPQTPPPTVNKIPNDSGPMWAPPVVGGAEVQNARVNPQTGETVVPGVTNRLPDPPKVSRNEQVVTLDSPDAATVESLRNQGYVSVPGLRSAEGHVQMVRGDVAPLYVTGDKSLPKEPTPAPIARPEVPSAIAEGQVGAGDIVPVPNENVTEAFISRMAEGGYKLVRKDATQSIFKRLQSERGSIELGQPREGSMTIPSGPKVSHGDSVQVVTKDGREVWLDNIQNPDEINAKIASGEFEISQVAKGSAGTEGGGPYDTARDLEYGARPITPEELAQDTLKQNPLPQYPPGPLKAGETYQSRLAESRRRVAQELDAFIQHGDDAPAETRTNSGTIEKVKDIAKRLIGDDAGTLNVSEALRQLRETMARLDEWELRNDRSPNQAEARGLTYEQRRVQADNREIDNITSIERARELRDFWQQEVTSESRGTVDEVRQRHAAEMWQRATQRFQEFQERLPRNEPFVPPADPFSRQPRVEVFNPRNGETVAQFGSVEEAQRYINERPHDSLDYDQIGLFDDDWQREHPSDAELARIEATEARHPDQAREWQPPTEATYGPENAPQYGPPRPTREEIADNAREALGVPNPPVKFGLQEPRRGRPNVSKEQVARLENTADPFVLGEAKRRRAEIDDWKAENKRRKAEGKEPLPKPRSRYKTGTWDEWGQAQIDTLPHGEPGLNIVDTGSSHFKSYTLEYRTPAGKPIGIAKVREDNSGIRRVSTLAVDRNAGLLTGRAFHEITSALADMNAMEPSGVISEFTARAIAAAARLIGDEKGSLEVSMVGDILKVIKDKILGGKSVDKLKSNVADVYADMMKNMPGKKVDVNWLAEKAREKTGWGQGVAGQQKTAETNYIREALAIPSAATTTGDLSAPGRQGLSMILTPQFWKAGAAMFKGMSPEGFRMIDADLNSKPIFQKRIDMTTGAVGKSYAEEIGMKLFRPASEAGPRAEATASRWLETGGSIPYASAAYRNTLGVPVRMSNRAFITFLNHLNANRTEFLLNKARDMSIEALDTGSARPGFLRQKFSPAEAQNLNPYHNLQLGKDIADFVNTATGHGPLKTHILPHKSAEISLEGSAQKLGYVMFSPGLLASRVRMLNPSTYIMAPPFVRKQYVKAALSSAAAWYGFTELSKMAGGEVGQDPTSADFGKVKIGDTRIDPGGGFLQFAVLYNRFYQGGYTSSATNQFHRFGEGFQAETQGSNLERFLSNKLNPVAKFAYDVAHASQYNPFHVKDRLAQMFVPLYAQDVIEIVHDNPDLVPWLVPMVFGVGAQTYSKGESVGKLIDPENDWLATGGGIADLGPDAINPRLDY